MLNGAYKSNRAIITINNTKQKCGIKPYANIGRRDS